MEDHKNALYEKSCVEKENERRKKLEDVRNYFLLERDDIRAINSAYVFTEVREYFKKGQFHSHAYVNTRETSARKPTYCI